jgi:hypothetical protein
MTPAELLTDHFERIHDLFADVVDDLSVDAAAQRVEGATRSRGCCGMRPASRTTTSPA